MQSYDAVKRNHKMWVEEELTADRKQREEKWTKSSVSDVLNRKRSLSMKQVVNLHHGMGIPYESLIDTKMVA